MSQVEICSRHKGKINVTTRAGKPSEVEFIDVSGRGPATGVATVDEDVADILLEIGLPDYWRPGQLNSNEGPEKTETGEGGNPEPPVEGDQNPPAGGEQDPPEPKAFTPEAYDALKNVDQLKEALAGCNEQAVIMALIAHESQKERTRNSWMDALSDRLDELQQA